MRSDAAHCNATGQASAGYNRCQRRPLGRRNSRLHALEGRAMETEFLQTVPILRIFDEAKAREFYVDFLGFQIDWEHRFEPDLPLYMQVSRAGLTLHLSEHVGDACPGSTVFVRMKGIEALHAELIAKKYKYLRPGIEIAPWKAKCMEVIDPFGNRIRFNEDLDS
jgi:catechol 2,3-dioxygenase-like lactoylglutathione lyase family enzyme